MLFKMVIEHPPTFAAAEVQVRAPEADVRVVEVGESQAHARVRAVGAVKAARKTVPMSNNLSSQSRTAYTRESAHAHGEGLPSAGTHTLRARAPLTDACCTEFCEVKHTVAAGKGSTEGSAEDPEFLFTFNISDCSAEEVATNETWGLNCFNGNAQNYRTFRQALTQMAAT